MKRFKCTVERTDEYIIEIDENVFNEEWMKNFSKCMFEVSEHEEIVEYIAQYRSKYGECFIEGFGRPLENGKAPIWCKDQRELEPAINITPLREDVDYFVEVDEI